MLIAHVSRLSISGGEKHSAQWKTTDKGEFALNFSVRWGIERWGMGGFLSRGEKRPVCPSCHRKFPKNGAIRHGDCSCAYELPSEVVKVPNGCQPPQSFNCSVTFSPYVFRRWSSQFFDVDGDLSHEFYEEIPARKHRKPVLVRIEHGLIPQGWVDYEFPRLRSDLPYVMVEVGCKPDV